MKPTYEQLEAELIETKKLLQQALEKIADLEEKLKLNSKNSSKPPSTDRKANTPIKDRKQREPRKGFARSVLPPERDLRKLVIWRKKSFGTRSDRGQRFVEQIVSVAETVKRQGQNALEFIQDTVANFFAGKPAPYICESLGIEDPARRS